MLESQVFLMHGAKYVMKIRFLLQLKLYYGPFFFPPITGMVITLDTGYMIDFVQ